MAQGHDSYNQKPFFGKWFSCGQLGQESLETTARYVHTSDKYAEDMHHKYHPLLQVRETNYTFSHQGVTTAAIPASGSMSGLVRMRIGREVFVHKGHERNATMEMGTINNPVDIFKNVFHSINCSYDFSYSSITEAEAMRFLQYVCCV